MMRCSYSYDGIGRRVSVKNAPGGGAISEIQYVWCGSVLCQARDASNHTLREYYGEGELTKGPSGRPLYYGIDQIGSVRRVFASAAEAPAYDYDAFGVPSQSTAKLTDFGFAGMRVEDPGGNYLTWYRAYAPSTGRWLSRDPIGENTDAAANLYAYASLDPLRNTDPMGLFPKPSPGKACGPVGTQAADGTPIDPAAKKRSPRFFCEECGAPHGGLYSPYCPDCYMKSQKPDSGIPPIKKPDWDDSE